MSYQLTSDPNTIYDTVAQAWIPRDPANRDYVQFLAWQEAGNTPEPAPLQPDPEELTPLQRLNAAGLTVEDLRSLLA